MIKEDALQLSVGMIQWCQVQACRWVPTLGLLRCQQ